MQADKKPSQSLYERLGGAYRIATLVDDFIDRITADPRLNENPRVKAANHRESAAGFKFLVTEMTCWATGGPQTYSGRSMADSHRHLQITEQEWDCFIDDMKQTLDKYHVAEAEQHELLSLMQSSKNEIVARG
jgi:hemoglobin